LGRFHEKTHVKLGEMGKCKPSVDEGWNRRNAKRLAGHQHDDVAGREGLRILEQGKP
jgi:hypothetical protein